MVKRRVRLCDEGAWRSLEMSSQLRAVLRRRDAKGCASLEDVQALPAQHGQKKARDCWIVWKMGGGDGTELHGPGKDAQH